ncbi:hypothetical protein Tco_0093344 [Tanacetum coccineum]
MANIWRPIMEEHRASMQTYYKFHKETMRSELRMAIVQQSIEMAMWEIKEQLANDNEHHGFDPSALITDEEMGKVSNHHHFPSIFMSEQPYSNDYPQTPKVITNMDVNCKVIKLVSLKAKHNKENT